MKKCTQCLIDQELTEFNKKTKSPDGLDPWCTSCKKKKSRERYQKNKEQIKERMLIYYKENHEDRKLYRLDNKDRISQYNKEYKQDNKKYISDYNKEYKLKNKNRIKEDRKQYRVDNKESINLYTREKLKSDPIFKMCKKVRNRLGEFLKTKGFIKKYKFEEYIGCTPEELKVHLEVQFLPGMAWENHGSGEGKWNIDHIIGLANAQNEERIYDLCHYKNLRPLWEPVNIIKQERADMCWQKLQRDKLLEEDIKNGFPINLEPKDFILTHEPLTFEHREFIKRYEWLGSIGFGVRHVFTARWERKLGGVIMIAEPNSYQFDKEIEALIQRGACASWTPKNLGSKLIMYSCKWMIQNTTKRIFTAYSDSEAGEIGTIYQACNFDYLGQKFGNTQMLITPEGKKVSDRFFTRTSAMKKWARDLNINWEDNWCKDNGFQNIKAIPDDIRTKLNNHSKMKMKECKKVKVKPKGKYVLLLNYGKNKIKKTWNSLPYPKRK